MKKSALMQKGKVKIIHVQDGQEVMSGQTLFSIAAEKVNYEIDSPKKGFVKLLVRADAVVPVGSRIA
jgi:pyruvate/2-oxoglutarate dehydrogenase complex dihydrolipoamide acyltransferase (E2) component